MDLLEDATSELKNELKSELKNELNTEKREKREKVIGKNNSESALIKTVWSGKKSNTIQTFENNFEQSKRKNFFSVARSNAENRLFELLKLSEEDITNFFKVEQDSYGNGVANIQTYDWIYKTTGNNNIIPLDDYITPPTKIVNGERVPVLFFVSYFFKNTEFLKKCINYYRQYNIDFKIIKLKTNDLWKIALKVTEPNSIVFKAD